MLNLITLFFKLYFHRTNCLRFFPKALSFKVPRFISIVTGFLIIATSTLFAQTQTSSQLKIDSIINLLKKEANDTTKIIQLNNLSTELRQIGKYDSAWHCGSQALKMILSHKADVALTDKFLLKDRNDLITMSLLKSKASVYNNLGTILNIRGNYDQALENHFTSLKFKKMLGDKKGMAGSYNNIGVIYGNQAKYSKALENYFAALKINEELGNKKWIAINYNNIGTIYKEQGNYSKALENHFASLKIKQEMQNKIGIAYSYNNIGGVYYDQKNYNKSLENYFASLKTGEEIGDKDLISTCYICIGNIYQNLNLYPKALENYFASLKIKEEMGDKSGIASAYINIGELYSKNNDFNKAISYLKKGLVISEDIGAKNNAMAAYKCLSEVYKKKEDFKSAYNFYQMYTQVKDSIFNEASGKQISEMSVKYETEKKEAQIQLLEKDKIVSETENKRQKFLMIFISAIALLGTGIAIIILRSLRLTRKQKLIIEQKELETQKQKNIIEEKHKEITDSINYAERIQRSFLASKQLLDDNLKDYFIFFQPKAVVSGDFYWAGNLNENTFALAVGDSTGHGVPGAIVSILNITCLENAIKSGLTGPAAILNHTRKEIIERLKQDGSNEGGKDGMDACFICFDFKSLKLVYSAANNPIWIIRDNQLIELKPDKMPVGKHNRDQIPFTENVFNLQKQDLVYALTDGMSDQFGGPKGKKFMYKHLKNLLLQISTESMSEQKQLLQSSLNNWKGGLEQIDDVCVVGIRI